MRKIILIVLIFFNFNINYSFWEELYWSWNEDKTNSLEVIEKTYSGSESLIKEPIPKALTEEEKEENILNGFYKKRKEQIQKLIENTKEEKDIESIENLKLELEIKKSFDEEYLKKINSELSNLQKKIEQNNEFLEESSKIKEKNSSLQKKIKEVLKNNSLLKKQSKFKEKIILDLKDSLNNYQLLDSKYKSLLSKYINIKKDKEKEKKEERERKLKYLYIFIITSFLIFLIKIIISRKVDKKYESIFVYFDLIFTIIVILSLIGFFFYFFPQLYIMLLFISWYLLYINSSLIWSFIWSIIVLKNYNIWDVIKHKEDFWKIMRITPLFTWIRILNDNWILTNRRENIPNILLIKEQVTVFKKPELQEHNFDIILPLKNNYNIFRIVKEIKDNIILKSLTNRPINVDKNSSDIFKTKYTQLDLETVKISFFWIDENIISRKIEKKILWYIKELIDDNEKEESPLKNKELD